MAENMVFNWAGQGPQAGGASATYYGAAPVQTPAADPFAAERAELAQLEAELKNVENEIAAFDQANPGIDSGDIEVAAKMMEAGNASPYQSMVGMAQSRAQGIASAAKNAEDAIHNAIDNAGGFVATLKAKDDMAREEARALMRVQLNKAERMSKESGVPLPDEWFKLDALVRGGGSSAPEGGDSTWRYDNPREFANDVQTKVNNNSLHDSDLEAAEKYAQVIKNSDMAKEIRDIVKANKYKTEEAKAKGKSARAAAETEAAAINALTDKNERLIRWNGASKNLKTYYTMDNDGIVKKK